MRKLDLGELRDRVARGAGLLDRAAPGWAERIRPDELALETCSRCVLGQLFGDYAGGFATLLRDEPFHQRYSAAAHGFTAIEQDDLSEFDALTDLWRAEVASRQARRESPETENRP